MSPCVDVVMVGTFPPPMHGMAAVNDAVRRQLAQAGAGTFVVDTAAPNLDRGLLPRIGRLPRIAAGWTTLALKRGLRDRAFYMSVSGGFGQVYDLLYVLLARVRGMRVFLHHHCYAYLDHPSRLTAMFVRAAGKNALHVALSPGMSARLSSCYRGIGAVAAVSNAALLMSAVAEDAPPRNRLGVLGFLSNISVEKGILDFLDVCAVIQARGLPLAGRIAGPFQDADVERTVRARLEQLPNVEYVGPRYGEDKTRFYREIDALLFPTRYANEAEPLTIHEALCAGVPVIAYARGAIPEMLTARCGKVIPSDAEFTAHAMDQVLAWLREPDALQAASAAARERFVAMRQESLGLWDAVEARMLKRASIATAASA